MILFDVGRRIDLTKTYIQNHIQPMDLLVIEPCPVFEFVIVFKTASVRKS
jgi:hypothetical protein